MSAGNEISQSNPGLKDDAPYVPAWCYAMGRPDVCECSHHEGFHNDAGECINRTRCGCTGYVKVKA